MADWRRIARIEFSKDSEYLPHRRLSYIACSRRKGKGYGMTLQEMRLLGRSDKAKPEWRPETVRFRGALFRK